MAVFQTRPVRAAGVLLAVLSITACVSRDVPARDSIPESTAREAIDVIYVPGRMEYTITDGGAGRILSAGLDLTFDATREDYQIIAGLLAPLQETGLTCSEPPQGSVPGQIIWRRGSDEVRRAELQTLCYTDGTRPLAGNADQAWRTMTDIGKARYVAPVIPEPRILSVERRYWGRLLSIWTVSTKGVATVTRETSTVTFEIPETGFAQIRELFRPYESRHFECTRLIADLPYGDVIWASEEGTEDQRTRFDEGCVSGDASDLDERLRRADALIDMWRSQAAVPGD